MSNNQKSETCPNRRDFFLSFKFMFSKQAPPLFIGRPNNFQFNRKVSRENCKRCIWNEVRENILKQSWFIWIMGPHKLSFKKKKYIYIDLVQLTTAIATMCPKHAQWDQKSPWAIHLRLSLTHTCKNVARAATTCETVWREYCEFNTSPEYVIVLTVCFPAGGAITCYNKLQRISAGTVTSRCPVIQSRNSCMSFVQYIIVKVNVFVLTVSRWCRWKGPVNMKLG